MTAPAPTNLDGQGEALFIAKGCLSCHINQRVGFSLLCFLNRDGSKLNRLPNQSRIPAPVADRSKSGKTPNGDARF